VEFYGEYKREGIDGVSRLDGVKRRRTNTEEGSYALHAPSEVDGPGRGKHPDNGSYALHAPLEGIPETNGEQPTVDSEERQDHLWEAHEIALLAKVTSAALVKDFKPIAMLPVLYKLYIKVLHMLSLSFIAPPFAFRNTTRHTKSS
jgi:hypothetical protein